MELNKKRRPIEQRKMTYENMSGCSVAIFS